MARKKKRIAANLVMECHINLEQTCLCSCCSFSLYSVYGMLWSGPIFTLLHSSWIATWGWPGWEWKNLTRQGLTHISATLILAEARWWFFECIGYQTLCAFLSLRIRDFIICESPKEYKHTFSHIIFFVILFVPKENSLIDTCRESTR